MVHAIETILSDSGLQGQLVQKGHQQAAQFTWQKAVAQTMDVYKSVVER
jgi:glycosyltransferase involved in cell wall biosynthesis